MSGQQSAVSDQQFVGQRKKPDGPNPYVLMAIFHRMHEFEKEQEHKRKAALALQMRSKRRSAISGQRLAKKAVKA